jgi:DNA polymerase
MGAGAGFGMGWKKLQMTLAMGFMGPPLQIDDAMAQHIVSVYRRANSAIVLFWDRLNVLLLHMANNEKFSFEIGPVKFMHKMIELPNGLALKYPGLRAEEDQVSYVSRYGRQSIWGGMLLENIVQALARCVVGEQMLKIHRIGYHIASMTHDEIITAVPTEQVDFAFQQQARIMTTPPLWAPDLPLAVDGGYDVNYSK